MSTPGSSPTADREIVLSREFDAPRALVWGAFTDPQQIVRWWGPNGFTTTNKKWDFRVGGEWSHTMHGPDGTDYPNYSKFREIVPQERIAYVHGGGREDGPGAQFEATWTFESLGPKRTRVTGRMVFPSAEARDTVVREYGAIEGGKQTLARLAAHLGRALDFDAALAAHFQAIANRDIQAFKSHLSLGDTLYTVVQNGHAFTTPAETAAIHEEWFKDPNWTWKGSVVHRVVGTDMAMALVRYTYQPNQTTAPFETWLVYVFQLQQGAWRIVHDQNTALDYHAFARAAGLEK